MTPETGDTIPTIISKFTTKYNMIDPQLRIDTMRAHNFATIQQAIDEAHRRNTALHAAILLNATGDRNFAIDVLSNVSEYSFDNIRSMMIQKAAHFKPPNRTNPHVFAAIAQDTATAFAAATTTTCGCPWRSKNCSKCMSDKCPCPWRRGTCRRCNGLNTNRRPPTRPPTHRRRTNTGLVAAKAEPEDDTDMKEDIKQLSAL